MGVSVNSLVKNFPFVYLCDGKAEYDDYVYLFYDKNEELNLTSSSEEIFESIFGFVLKEFLKSEYIISILVNILETSERFVRVKTYLIDVVDGVDDYDVELDEVLKKLPNDIIEYYTNVIHDRDVKKENQDDKDRRIDYLEEEVKEVKDELFKFKCQMKYELSGWEGFCKFINIV